MGPDSQTIWGKIIITDPGKKPRSNRPKLRGKNREILTPHIFNIYESGISSVPNKNPKATAVIWKKVAWLSASAKRSLMCVVVAENRS